MSTQQHRPILLYLVGAVGVAAAAGGVIGMARGRTAEAQHDADARAAELEAGPRVLVARAKLSAPERHIELQGEARPFASVTLYAKVSGYLKQIPVDKGDRVRAGQLVAVIESPELDRQFDAAVADAAYKRANARRSAALSAPGVVSTREAELDESQARVADAQVAALETQKSYETLRAPFAGTVTARFADPGALVQNAANAQTSALPVVTISQTERLRVYVYVDQRDAALVREGDTAEVTVPDTAVRVKGTVTRRAQELDTRTRTMLVEVDLDNRDGKIVPGSFVWVTLTVKAPREVEVPAEALIQHGKVSSVALVEDGVVHFRPVEVSSDDGIVARLHAGVKEGDPIALHLGNAVDDGARVQAIESKPDAPRH